MPFGQKRQAPADSAEAPSLLPVAASRDCRATHLNPLEKLWLIDRAPQGRAWVAMRNRYLACLKASPNAPAVAAAMSRDLQAGGVRTRASKPLFVVIV